jgi:hypothetical protein
VHSTLRARPWQVPSKSQANTVTLTDASMKWPTHDLAFPRAGPGPLAIAARQVTAEHRPADRALPVLQHWQDIAAASAPHELA